MNKRALVDVPDFESVRERSSPPAAGRVFEQNFIQQLLVVVRPEIKALVNEVFASEIRQPLVVDYEEAGRMIGTTYEGIRKLVRKGTLRAVSRSGRHRGIAVQELKDYVERSQVSPGLRTTVRVFRNERS